MFSRIIDDIELIEVDVPCVECQGCSPTDGCINVTSNNIHRYIDDQCAGTLDANPLTLFNLENVSYLKWEILPVNGGAALRTIEAENPRGKLSWDGKNDNGVEVPDGNYIHKYIVANDCEGKKKTENFTKAVSITSCDPSIPSSSDTPILFPDMNYGSIDKVDYGDDCCYECITIDASTGYSILTGEQSFVAINKINVGPNVFISSGTSLTLQAGEAVNIIGGENSIIISSIDNAESVIEIVEECEPMMLSFVNPSYAITASSALEVYPSMNEVESISFRQNEQAESLKNESEIANFRIFPNPSRGDFQIECEGCFLQESQLHLVVYDSRGGIVLEQFVNSSSFQNASHKLTVKKVGVYLISLSDGENIYSQKIMIK